MIIKIRNEEIEVNDIQKLVDKYLSLHQEYKETEVLLERLRSVIQPFMEEYEINALEGDESIGCIRLEDFWRSIPNSKYTYYNAEIIIPLLTSQQKKQCVVEVVDKDSLEALNKLKLISDEILTHKLNKKIKKFTAIHK